MSLLLSLFIKGLVFGVTMAAIPGPIFFLIVQRTLADGALTGLACALGAVTADTVYALLAVIGLACVAQFLIVYQSWLTLVGGFFLLYLGISTYRRKLVLKTVALDDTRLTAAWFSTFLLTLTNPVTIISYSIIFAGLGLVGTAESNYLSSLSLIGGVILGASSVAALLVTFVSSFRQQLSPYALNIINKTASIVLIGFGLAALIQGLKGFI
jgi:threonine/homoserine/homoserine lactone efflux protein